MTPAEPEKANLIALTHARTALRHYADPPGRRCYTPPEQRNNTSICRSIASVTALVARWRRRRVLRQIFTNSFTGRCKRP